MRLGAAAGEDSVDVSRQDAGVLEAFLGKGGFRVAGGTAAWGREAFARCS